MRVQSSVLNHYQATLSGDDNIVRRADGKVDHSASAKANVAQAAIEVIAAPIPYLTFVNGVATAAAWGKGASGLFGKGINPIHAAKTIGGAIMDAAGPSPSISVMPTTAKVTSKVFNWIDKLLGHGVFGAIFGTLFSLPAGLVTFAGTAIAKTAIFAKDAVAYTLAGTLGAVAFVGSSVITGVTNTLPVLAGIAGFAWGAVNGAVADAVKFIFMPFVLAKDVTEAISEARKD